MYVAGMALNWLRLGAWLIIGLVFYFGYGKQHSKLETQTQAARI